MRKETVAIIILAIGLVIAVSLNVWQYSSNQQLNTRLDALNQSFINLNQSFLALNQQYDELLHSFWAQHGSQENAPMGLIFDMALNTTFLLPGQSITITLSETNRLSSFNNITSSNNWNYSGFQSQFCDGIGLADRPFTIAIIQGYHTEFELNGTSSLPIFYAEGIPVFCVYIGPPPHEYDFYPSSNDAIINYEYFREPLNASMISSMSFSGYYTPFEIQNATLTRSIINFTQGVYTVVAGDEWGQLIVLHFVVL